MKAKKPVTKKVPKRATRDETQPDLGIAEVRATAAAEAMAIVMGETPVEIKKDETNDAEVWELRALMLVDDPDFTYSDADPDAPRWDAAFAALQTKGLMTIEQDPKNPNNSLFVMTAAGREALDQL
jgi:hypothetical protein